MSPAASTRAGVGGEQSGEVLRLGQRGAVRQRAGEVFGEARADLLGEGTGFPDLLPERVLGVGKPEGFELRQAARSVRRLHLDDAAFRYLAFARLTLLCLLRRLTAEIRMARSMVSKFANAEHLRLERCAEGVQQIGEQPVRRAFPDRTAEAPTHPRSVKYVSTAAVNVALVPAMASLLALL